MRFSCAMVAVACTALAVGQRTPVPSSARDDVQVWHSRADYLTSQVLDESNHLDPVQRLLLPARLAAALVKAFPARARALAKQAADGVSIVPQNEAADDRRARSTAATLMVADLNLANRSAADEVIAMLMKDSRDNSNARPSENDAIGNALAESVHDISPSDPGRAFELAEKTLALGDDADMAGNYQALRDAQQDLANRYLLDAVRAAQSDPRLLFALGDIAEKNPNLPPDRRMPDATREAILHTISDRLLQNGSNAAQRQANCQAAPAALEVLDQYSQAEQGQIRVAARACKGINPNLNRSIDYQERSGSENSPEENSPSDLQQRVQQKIERAQLASHHDLLAALDVMDSFTAEERDAAYPNWHLLWIGFATRYIRNAEKEHDTGAIDRVVARAPSEVRGRVLLAAANAAYSAEDADSGNAFLGQAERDIEGNPQSDQYALYQELLNLCAAHLRADTLNALRIAVDGFNNFKPRNNKFGTGFDDLQPLELNAGLLDADYDSIVATIAGISDAARRTAMRLGLLHLLVDRYEASLRTPAPKRKISVKK